MTLAALGFLPMRDAGNDGASVSSPRELDPATLAACRAGDPSAIRAFVVQYQGLVFAFLSRSLGRGPHVEDLAQEVFLRACRALPDFESDGSARLSTWLLTIASRLAIDARRKRHVPTVPLDPEQSARSLASGTPETERERRELGRALEAAAAQLPPDQREAFLLAELHGLEMSEMAKVQGVSESTAKTRLFRARSKLRELLRGVWESRLTNEEPEGT